MTAVGAAESAVVTALSSSAWPADLTPTPDNLGDSSRAAAWDQDHCLALDVGTANEAPQKTAQRCVYGDPDGQKRMVLLGDSIAISWLPALEASYGKQGWRIDVFTMMQCPYSPVGVRMGDGRALAPCAEYRDWTLKQIKSMHPAFVVASQADSSLGRLTSGNKDAAADAEVTKATERFISEASGLTDRLILLGAPPQGQNVQVCYSRTAAPSACVGNVFSDHNRMNAAIATAVQNTASANTSFIDTTSLLCSKGKCPAFVDGHLMTADGRHLTQQFAIALAPAVQELIMAQTTAD